MSRRLPVPIALIASFFLFAPLTAQQDAPGDSLPSLDEVWLPAGVSSGLPLVQPNDNRRPAGVERDGVRDISLEVVRADWRVETAQGPGLRVAAVAEAGDAPSIPAPLIRVEEGTLLRVSVRNALTEDSITVFGLHSRPGEEAPSLSLAPGASATVEFSAGEPGTYLYRIEEGERQQSRGEREQLAGAFVVDPEGGSPPDRILMMNIFSQPVSDSTQRGVEGLSFNGLSWPYSERLQFEVGDTQTWRVINGSRRFHPMHLHGFFFSVRSRGTVASDTIYAPEAVRDVVTEPMRPWTTMTMEWTPAREGTWLFHCHLSFHVSSEVRLPGAEDADPEHAHSHMAGLVLGIEITPGDTDLISEGEPVAAELYTQEYSEEPGYQYGFTVDPDARPDSLNEVPGPLLVFNQYQTVDLKVENRMSIPTGVHWHGLELEAWADGVPDYSASAGRTSPVIAPGESFTYRLAMMRPGTFMYHSHLDDVDQLLGGLFGPLIVLPRGETFDARTDHVRVASLSRSARGVTREINGMPEPPDMEAVVGETHRFRIVHIAPAGQVSAWIARDGEPVPITLHAKDGADLPVQQRVPVERLERMGVGETADFLWTPTEPGVYELRIGRDHDRSIPQTWVVKPREG